MKDIFEKLYRDYNKIEAAILEYYKGKGSEPNEMLLTTLKMRLIKIAGSNLDSLDQETSDLLNFVKSAILKQANELLQEAQVLESSVDAEDTEEEEDPISEKYKDAAISFACVLKISPDDISTIKNYKLCLEKSLIFLDLSIATNIVNTLECALKKEYKYELYKVKNWYLDKSIFAMMHLTDLKNCPKFQDVAKGLFANQISLFCSRSFTDQTGLALFNELLCNNSTVKILDIAFLRANLKLPAKWRSLKIIHLSHLGEFLLNKYNVPITYFASNDVCNPDQEALIAKCDLLLNNRDEKLTYKELDIISMFAGYDFIASKHSPYLLMEMVELRKNNLFAKPLCAGIANSPIGIAIPLEVMAYIMSYLSEKEKGQLLFVCKS